MMMSKTATDAWDSLMGKSDTRKWKTTGVAGLEAGTADGVCEETDQVLSFVVLEDPFSCLLCE